MDGSAGSSSQSHDQENKFLSTVIGSPLLKSCVAGTVGGTMSTLLLQPLDLVKTRLQKSANLGSKLGMMKELSNVVKQEKIKGLWSGLVPSLYRTVPGVGIYFTGLYWLRSTFSSTNPHPFESIVIGASARSLADIIVLPFTVMKTRYESGEFNYRQGLRQAIKTTYAKEGFRGLYSGLTPTLLRDVPYSGLYLMFYLKLKSVTPDYSNQCSMLVNFCNGALAACLSSFVTQPVDVIKTNMQLYPSKYGRLKNVIHHVYHESGLKGFQRGFVPRTLRRTLMSAMTWSVYEEIMRVYHLKV